MSCCLTPKKGDRRSDKDDLCGAIHRAIASKRTDLREFVQTLIRIPTVNKPPFGDERAAQEYLYARARSKGLDATLYEFSEVEGLEDHPAFHSGRHYDGRPNLLVKVPGMGRGRSLLFTGHVDVVPAGDQGDWSYPPFGGVFHNGRIYGRGSWDMKAGLACGLFALEILSELGIALEGDIAFESVVDEEFAGANGTVAGRARGDRYDGAVILEPTNLNLYNASRGLRVANVTIAGRPGVTFGDECVINPVEKIGPLVEWFQRFGQTRNERLSRWPGYEGYEVPAPFMVTRVYAGEMGPNGILAVPSTATVQLFWETLPGEEMEDVDREFREGIEAWIESEPGLQPDSVRIEYPYRWIPGSAVPPTHPLVEAATTAIKQSVGQPPRVFGAPYPCDAFVFNLYSQTPAIIFGPRGANAHAPDEYVNEEDLALVVESLCFLALEWCGVAGLSGKSESRRSAC